MAAVDYFLKIEGHDGESHDSKHKNEIDVLSWSWSEANSGTMAGQGGGGAGKVSMNDISFSFVVNKAAPGLMLACASGEHIKKAVLTCRRAGKEQQEYMIWTFSDLLVSSFQMGGSQGDVVPICTISMNFSKVEFSYAEQKADGSLDSPKKTGYDLKLNKKA
jgi:type VI secretion system secreted protein Hcp